MNVGIMTFHWAANYGAVLQAYALSEYLTQRGNDVKVIDYYPRRFKKNLVNAFATRHISAIAERVREISKEKNIAPFRKKYLKLTRYFKSNKELSEGKLEFDCCICGSDQIWNESFLCSGERKKTYSYFLNFAPDDKIIASYAASFGVAKYRDELKSDIKKYLNRFDFISVRENTGLDILKDIGINIGCVVPDPTLLLKKNDYEKFLIESRKEKYDFVYMLHGKDDDANDLIKYENNKGVDTVACGNISIEEWLSDIYYANHIITNSFHGTVFSIIFERPFTAILIEGSGMNDRIITLLDKLELSDRIYTGDTGITEKPIDWENTKKRLNEYRSIGYDYIDKILNYKKELKHEN